MRNVHRSNACDNSESETSVWEVGRQHELKGENGIRRQRDGPYEELHLVQQCEREERQRIMWTCV